MFRIEFPNQRYHSIAEISIDELLAMGIRAVLLDLDNTCTPRKSWLLTAEAKAWISKAKAARMIVVIVSNTVTGGKRIDRVRKIATDAEVQFVCARFPRLKPHPHPYRQALKIAGVRADQAVMIGDQLFTDVKGAKKLGMMAILVDPLGNDHWATRHRRWRQNRILRKHGYNE